MVKEEGGGIVICPRKKVMIISRNINGIDFAVNPHKSASLLCEEHIANLTQGNIYAFVEYLYEQTQQYTPMVATWEITNICNFSCTFCYINSEKSINKQFISLDKAKEMIDVLVEEGLLLVYLTGGEVLSHPNFEEIYKYLKLKGVYVVLLTNLSLLDEDKLKLLKEYPPLRVTASLYGISEKQFSGVTQNRQISPQKIMDNILLLKDNGINITAQTPINKATIEQYEMMANWCYEHGIIYRTNNDLTNSYFDEDRQNLYIETAEFNEIKSRLRFITEEPLEFCQTGTSCCKYDQKRHFDCISGKHTFAISYNLHIRPCFNIWETEGPWFDASLSIKDALDELKEYLNSKKLEVIEYCKGCVAHKFCRECMMTQNRNRVRLKEYMKEACSNNMRLFLENQKS